MHTYGIDRDLKENRQPLLGRIEAWLRSALAEQLGTAPQEISLHTRFRDYGLDSVQATALLARLGAYLQRPLPVALLWSHPSPAELAQALAGQVSTSRQPAPTPAPHTQPIAVVGMSCRFPGGATSPEAFWDLLRNGHAAPVSQRWLSAQENGACPPPAALLDDIERFDSLFFAISPREAAQMDPQQRIILELAWEALEDAGIIPQQLAGSRTAVLIGAMWPDYARLTTPNPRLIDQHSATGQDLSIIAARIAYTLGLQGPALTLNTACSSSLMAVHLACQSLRSGEADLAFAGGVNLLIAPESAQAMQHFGGLAPDGRCKTFDAAADGYGRGEGAALLILKRLADALADGDSIYCVIRGTAANNDGASNGLTAPNPLAQEALLREAYQRAGVDPAQVQYVEAHGTGTPLGDPIECHALGAVLGTGRSARHPLRIGSVKTNIGHLEAVAGVAGLIKVALALHHDLLPPSLHFLAPNRHIPFDDWRLAVQTELSAWPEPDRPRLAGVSSFGFAGTNCHAVLEGFPRPAPLVLPLAADGEPQLQERIDRLAAMAQNRSTPLASLCQIAVSQRSPGAQRMAIIASTTDELAARLDALRSGVQPAQNLRGSISAGSAPGVVWVFSGQGAQWPRMGHELLAQEPAFRAAVQECDACLQPLTGWSLLRELAEGPRSERLADVTVLWPVLFSLQVGLAALWRSWGLAPAAVVGHSIGEVAAAYVAGALDLKEAARVIVAQSQAAGARQGRGAMALVELDWQSVEQALHAFGDAVAPAISHSPRQTVITGEQTLVAAAVAAFQQTGTTCRLIETSVAAHGPALAEAVAEIQTALDGVGARRPTLPLVSGSTGRFADETYGDAAYWATQLRTPVRFCEAIQRLSQSGYRLYLEINAHPIVGHGVAETLAALGHAGIVLASLKRDEPARAILRHTAAVLYAQGLDPVWERVCGTGAHEAEGSRQTAHLIPLSARTPDALKGLALAYHDWLGSTAATGATLADLGYTASMRRGHLEERAAIVSYGPGQLAGRLAALARGEPGRGIISGRQRPGERPKLAFVFSGQGAQWPAMGQQLLEQEPVFRATVAACDRLIRRIAGWSLLAELTSGDARWLEQIDTIQPALFSLQVGLTALWASWGIVPDAVVGHSMGEVAAAYAAGALSLESAVGIICRRSQLLRRTSGRGAMAIVEIAEARAQQLIDQSGCAGEVSIALCNGPQATVLSGDPAALRQLIAPLEGQGIFCRWLKVDVAAHSPQMDPLCPDLLEFLRDLLPGPAAVPIYSTVTGGLLDGAAFDARYWARNLREPVRFSTAVRQLLEDNYTLYLEIGPHPILLPAIEQTAHVSSKPCDLLPSLRREEPEQEIMRESLGQLYTLGYPVDWRGLYPRDARVIRLPTYPWQRQRFWLDSTEDQPPASSLRSRRPPAGAHPLLAEHLELSTPSGAYCWTIEPTPQAHAYLQDHRVRGQVVVPAAALIDAILCAARAIYGAASYTLEQLSFAEALFLAGDGDQAIQLVFVPASDMVDTFRIASRRGHGQDRGTAWIRHVSGTVRRDSPQVPGRRLSIAELQQISAALSASEHYAGMAARGLEYGPGFQGVTRLWRRDGEALGSARPETSALGYDLNPTLLDACLQIAVATLPAAPGADQAFLPVAIDRLLLQGQPATGRWGYARASAPPQADQWAGDVFLLDAEGQIVVEIQGLGLRRLEHADTRGIDECFYLLEWQRRDDQQRVRQLPDRAGSWMIFADRHGAGAALKGLLEAYGETCLVVEPGPEFRPLGAHRYQLNPSTKADFAALLAEISALPPCRGVLHLWSLDAQAPSAVPDLEAAQVLGCGSVLHLLQALNDAGWSQAPHLWLITAGTQPVGQMHAIAAAQAPLWGLARTIVYEHSELPASIVDLSSVQADVEIEALFRELWAERPAEQLAIRGQATFVPRLVQQRPDAGMPWAEEHTRLLGADEPFQVVAANPGMLDTLRMHTASIRQPGRGEVTIEVYATGLNFMNVMAALGILPGYQNGVGPLGIECAGRIVAIGTEVEGLRIGDEVVAVAADSLASHAVAKASLVALKPANLSFEQAAAIPVAFLTAQYALHHLGRLSQGERVLIHAAAGGVGLAAVQLAQQAGAEIFATAGSPEKRAYLRSLGVHHVADSRSLSFVDDVLADTGGAGVDLVLNSLAGEALHKSLSLLAPYGRFLEIGKRDIYQDSKLGLSPFQKNLSYFAIDLDRMFRERPAFIGRLLRELLGQFAAGTLGLPPVQVFPIADVADAFRTMAQARHIGKIVIATCHPDGVIAVAARRTPQLRADATYLISGGLGGLGLTVAQWMVGRGARQLVLAGRRAPSQAARQVLSALEQAGARVLVAAADLGREDQVVALLKQIAQELPPLRGVVHAAGILDDQTLAHMSAEQLQRVLAPKVSGGWNLHRHTLGEQLDFFVLFSSVASLLGMPGQGNYAAANAFLDALAHQRRLQGLSALSINWGPWAEVGLATRPDRGERLALRGMGSITPQQGLAALERLLFAPAAQIGVMRFDADSWRASYAAAATSPLLAGLLPGEGAQGSSADTFRAKLLATSSQRRRLLLEEHLKEQIGHVARLAAAAIDSTKPLRSLGFDSLMTIELRNRLELSLQLTLSSSLIWNYPTVEALVPHLAERLGLALEEEPANRPSQAEAPAEPNPFLADLEQLSEADAEALLLKELDQLDY